MLTILVLISIFVIQVLGHGRVTSPKPRGGGTKHQAACGAAVAKVLSSDPAGPIENAVAKIDSSYNATACHLYFCRGYNWEDNTSNTRKYKAGQVVPFTIDIVAHHTGTANVSVVNLTTQKVIGSPLIYWKVYSNTSIPISQKPANETAFNVTIPSLPSGHYALQWWWWAYSNKQTYESCIDFTI
ncbi:SubName: Full=Uncharacterized protein {ECO:0000313/EMBL:CCA75257.1} [Serendipita indica DSM 11827]|nr:SubName: Full=Uncharacterized protein {ECO:0000313/EMBL:CCA75257.1} [Serendipita indica DSM 11827]